MKKKKVMPLASVMPVAMVVARLRCSLCAQGGEGEQEAEALEEES